MADPGTPLVPQECLANLREHFDYKDEENNAILKKAFTSYIVRALERIHDSSNPEAEKAKVFGKLDRDFPAFAHLRDDAGLGDSVQLKAFLDSPQSIVPFVDKAWNKATMEEIQRTGANMILCDNKGLTEDFFNQHFGLLGGRPIRPGGNQR